MRLGDKLKKLREDMGFKIDEVSKLTRIPLKYLEALENGQYSRLPKAKAHRLAYVRELAKIYCVSVNECVEKFENEFGLADANLEHPTQGVKLFPFASISIFIRNFAAFTLVIIFAGYLAWQVRGVLQPPKLTIFTPTEGYVASALKTLIEGETEKESRLTINGSEIMVSEEGLFSANLDLSPGVNTIHVSATKKHGKTTTITRHVVVKLPANREPLTLKN